MSTKLSASLEQVNFLKSVVKGHFDIATAPSEDFCSYVNNLDDATIRRLFDIRSGDTEESERIDLVRSVLDTALSEMSTWTNTSGMSNVSEIQSYQTVFVLSEYIEKKSAHNLEKHIKVDNVVAGLIEEKYELESNIDE